ncbi:hypothetical protein BUALT_Bualt09G0083000 [Buddleja alternifolia]|uniref:Uncharacterized protein n=1 Tax=Buddleja alternifolia TaxID=168488 RepID=A0AAV6X1I2_9LAMI|nr:hypothetical protein BUALT_Bualt09G0083000 [Buddleja alternifolia]
MKIKVKGKAKVVKCEGLRMFTRSVFKLNDEESEIDNENLGNLRGMVIVEVDGFMIEKSNVLSSLNARKMEMKILKKILLKDAKSNEPAPLESDDSDRVDRCYVPMIRPSEANDFVVYTRNKRLKSRMVMIVIIT